MEKYGVESPNQHKDIKKKQHENKGRNTEYETGPAVYNEPLSHEELCKVRSINAKKKWENGDYDEVNWKESANKRDNTNIIK